MLIKFRVKNVKSFKGLAELNLLKGKQMLHNERIAEIANSQVLKFSSIFGANASGKSNLVKALKIMQFLVINNKMPTDAYNEYFKLDDKCINEPSYFEVIVSIDNHIYSYGFEIFLVNGAIYSEWLVELDKKVDGSYKELKIFERSNRNITIYSNNKPINYVKDNYRLFVYKEDVEENDFIFFLNKIGTTLISSFNSNVESVKKIYDVYAWFQESLKVVYPNNTLITPEMLTSSNEKIGKILKAFDTGITKIESIEVTEEEFVKNSNIINFNISIIKNLLLNKPKKNNYNPKLMFNNQSGLWIVELNGKDFKYYNYAFIHESNSKKKFYSQDESDGTLRLFELIEAISTDDKNSVFVIDELDRCLHPRLTMQFVKTFLSLASDKNNNNQLIVTTHESRLLNFEIVRRDEIWFTEKKDGISRLYSLEEFNERFDKIIDKAYMEGRYGGVPVFDQLFLSDMVSYEN